MAAFHSASLTVFDNVLLNFSFSTLRPPQGWLKQAVPTALQQLQCSWESHLKRKKPKKKSVMYHAIKKHDNLITYHIVFTLKAQTFNLHYEGLVTASKFIRGTACINSSIGGRGSLNVYVAPLSGDVLVFEAPPHLGFWVTSRVAL